MELQEAYEDALAKLRANEATADRLAKEKPLLVAEVAGLKLALERHGGKVVEAPTKDQVPSGSAHPESPGPLANLSRPAAIRAILAQSDMPLSPTDLLKRLRDAGRSNDHAHVVSAALSNLQAKGHVEKISRGQWALARNGNINDRDGAGVLAPLYLEESEGRSDN